jgi:hypothetical protein
MEKFSVFGLHFSVVGSAEKMQPPKDLVQAQACGYQN